MYFAFFQIFILKNSHNLLFLICFIGFRSGTNYIDMMYYFLTVLFVMAIYSAPGIILANLVWTDTASRTEKVIFGSVIGLAFSCYISVIISYFIGWNPPIIIASIIALTVIGLVLKRKFSSKGYIIGLSPMSKGEFLACSICVCFVCVFLLPLLEVHLPYSAFTDLL